MAAARSKLVSNWRLPGWYCGGQSTSWAPRRAASRSVQAASARCGRASAHRSARPEAMMALAWSASKMAPTAMVGMPASLRTRSANGVWYMRPYTGFWSGLTWPEEQSIMSAPAALKRRAISTASSGVMPPSTQSWAEMRTDMGLSCGQAARTASNTSSGKRRRVFQLPPYSSYLPLVDGRGAGHLHHHQARTTHGARAQVHQVEVARHAVGAGIHGHGRDHDAVLQPQAARLVGREHGHGRAAACGHGLARMLGNPALEALQPGGIAQAQVLVRDALRARQQRIGELLRLQARIALHVLEPFRGIARRVLDLEHLHAAHLLVVAQAGLDAPRRPQAARQLDRILQRQLGARANREMRPVRRIAHQHHRNAARAARPVHRIPVHPGIADHARKADPDGRAA